MFLNICDDILYHCIISEIYSMWNPFHLVSALADHAVLSFFILELM